jgi:putative tryptophan/tyrosine transport system substrate-binding protein
MSRLGRTSVLSRRSVVVGLASLLLHAPHQVSAQPTGQRPKVAILSPITPEHAQTPDSRPYILISGLADLGYADGRTVSLEYRFAHSALERLPALAAELVATQPDVLWTWTSAAARATAAATKTIPIVIGLVSEDIMAELVANFARPEGNITGLTLNSRMQHEKCLQLLKEAVPSVRRVAVLLNPLSPFSANYPDLLGGAARSLGIELMRAEARGSQELDQAFAAMAAQGADGLFALNDATTVGNPVSRRRLLELIVHHRLPAIADHFAFAHAGGLLALGSDDTRTTRRSALYVHRILQGIQVSELPVEISTGFNVTMNLKVARALGLDIPASVLARADEVIE